MLSFSLLALYFDLIFGLLYLLNVLLLVYFSSQDNERGFLLFILSLVIFIFYLLRPLVLWTDENYFIFRYLGEVNNNDHYYALIEIFIFSFASLFSFRLAAGDQKRNRVAHIGNIYSARVILILLSIFGILYGLFASSIGDLKEYLTIILPFGLVQTALIVLVVVYWDQMNINERRLVLLLLLVPVLIDTIGGSKGAMLGLVFSLIVVHIMMSIYKGENNLSFGGLLKLIAFLFIVLFSFVVAWVIRSSDYMTFENFVDIFSRYALNSDAFMFFTERFTSRLLGYDGIIAARMFANDNLLMQQASQFNILSGLTGALGKLIPGYSAGGEYSFGKLVSIYFQGHPPDMKHSGALGLFGVLRINTLLISISITIMFFVGYGLLFRLVARVFICPTNYVFVSVLLVMNMVGLLSSGNLDNNFASFIRTIIVLTFYTLLFNFIVMSIRGATKIRVSKAISVSDDEGLINQ